MNMNLQSTRAEGKSPRTVGSIERLDPALDKLVPANAEMEVIGEGFEWCEGPVWIRTDSPPHRGGAGGGGFLLFSDIPNNAVMKWDAKSGVKQYLKPAGYTGKDARGGESGSNGLTVDGKGRLILCQHGDRRVARLDSPYDNPKPKYTTIADRYNGKRFNSPNDAVVHSSGAIYFTDPPYGLEKNMDDPAKELDFQGVYRIAPDGKVTLLTKELERPNGIGLSPDEKTLYVANSDSVRNIVVAFPIKTDGTLAEAREIFSARELIKQRPGSCDGLTVDQQGNVFVTVPGGVAILTPAGKHIGTLVTNDRTANVEFGEDGSTLFICANHNLLRIRTTTKGIGY
jgi:gluconolactonase